MDYMDLKDGMETGDIVLFGGQYHISKIIEKLTGCPYSHVGIVIRIEGIEEPLLFETTTLDNLEDVVFKDRSEGPKIVDLYERLKTYGQELVPYVPPTFAYHPITMNRDDRTVSTLLDLHRTYHGYSETTDQQMILDVILGRFLGYRVKKTDFFCSEWVAMAYQLLGLIGDKPPYNAYMPKDFSNLNRYIRLKNAVFQDQIAFVVT